MEKHESKCSTKNGSSRFYRDIAELFTRRFNNLNQSILQLPLIGSCVITYIQGPVMQHCHLSLRWIVVLMQSVGGWGFPFLPTHTTQKRGEHPLKST